MVNVKFFMGWLEFALYGAVVEMTVFFFFFLFKVALSIDPVNWCLRIAENA